MTIMIMAQSEIRHGLRNVIRVIPVRLLTEVVLSHTNLSSKNLKRVSTSEPHALGIYLTNNVASYN